MTKNYSNPMNIAKLEETLNFLKQQGVTDVYIQIKDGNNVEFCDIHSTRYILLPYQVHAS